MDSRKVILEAVLNTLDIMLKNDSLCIRGIEGIQRFSGCLQAIQNVINEENKEDKVE